MKKSKFLSVCFGAGFGAGQMYLGMQKKGVMIMGGSAMLIALASILHLEEVLVFLPVIWIYSFFDTLNMYPLSLEERKQEDELFTKKLLSLVNNKEATSLLKKRHAVAGWGFIAVGAYVLLGEFVGTIASLVDHWIYSSLIWRIYHIMPRVFLALIIIYIGAKLIKRNVDKVAEAIPKIEVSEQEEMQNGYTK